jgi:hypothetical protein
MLARVMLVLLFVTGVAMVIAGIVVCVDATSYGVDESIRRSYMITGWILMGLGVMVTLVTALLAIIVSVLAGKK